MNIHVLGYFGYITNQLDGQTVKTRTLYDLVTSTYSEATITRFDTQELKSHKLRFIKMLYQVSRSSVLIYLPGQANLKVIFPIVYLVAKLCGVKIHYFVVGGWLADYLADKPRHVRMLQRVAGIYPEIDTLSQRLTSTYGLEKVVTFPNFRDEVSSDISRPPLAESEPIRLLYFARVMPEKGIDIIFDIATKLRNDNPQHPIVIDVYGQLCYDKVQFEDSLQRNPNVIFRGDIEPSKVNETLSQYDVMLFPTHYHGEGCPGTITDALLNGLVTICSDWKYNGSFIKDGESGFLCSPYEAEPYYKHIVALNNDKALLRTMQAEARKSSEMYTTTAAAKILRSVLKF